MPGSRPSHRSVGSIRHRRAILYYAKIVREETQQDSELMREQDDAPEAQVCLNQSAALRKRMDESSIPD